MITSKSAHTPYHQGYLDGYHGRDPEDHSYPQYEEGWLKGAEDREAGVQLPKYFGYYSTEELPFKQGDKVKIPKGTTVKSTGNPSTKVAGRSYTVTVVSIDNGRDSFQLGDQFYEVDSPRIVWAGSGGCWMSANINDILPQE